MSLFIGILDYLGLAGVLILAWMVLRAFHGASLLAVYVICAGLQTGLAVFSAVEAAGQDVSVDISSTAADRFGIALLIFYAITGLFLYLLLRLRKQKASTIESKIVHLPETWKIAAVAMLVLFLGVRMLSPTSARVIEQGGGAIASGQYYELRGEIIDLDLAEINSRTMFYLETTLRRVLFVILIVSAFELLTVPSTRALVFMAILFVGLTLAEMSRFQKGPMAWVVAAAVVPFILGRSRLGTGSPYSTIAKIGTSAGVLILISGALYSLTEDLSFGEGFGRVINRFFVVPAYTSMMYFEVYPFRLPHVEWADLRPVRELFGTTSLQPANGLIAIDVAESLTGIRWSPNAGIVAESWAAAGYLGVVLGTLALCAFGFVVDRNTSQRLGKINMTPLAIYYWLGLLVYGNSALLYALAEHGLWFVPFLYCFAIDRATRMLRRRRQALATQRANRTSAGSIYLPGAPPVKPV